MAIRGTGDDTFINSIVGPGTFFRGHVELQGLLRIDGDFSGSVKTDGRVIVGKAGRADCAVEAGTVVVGGLFRGEILAYEKVVLLSSCVVLGTVTAPRLIVEEGVLLSGRCRVTGSAEDLVPASDSAARRKGLLLESVEKREQSGAAGRTTRSGQSAQQRSGAEQTSGRTADVVGAAAKESTSWNG